MSPQEIFDTVVRHLYAQGRPAVNSFTETCVYRGAENTRCAVGCLIPDELYRPEMEGMSVDQLLYDYPALRFLGVENENLLQALQCVHDGLAGPSNLDDSKGWTQNARELLGQRLRAVAERYKLVVDPEVGKLKGLASG